MRLTLIKDGITELKLSNKKEAFMIKQLKFIGAEIFKESTRFTYFRFKGDLSETEKYLGLN